MWWSEIELSVSLIFLIICLSRNEGPVFREKAMEINTISWADMSLME
jgi:hypothetical protein